MTPALAMLVLSVMTFVAAAVTFGLVELIAGHQDDSRKCPPDCPACPERDDRVSTDN
jgi:hypothetical protein